MTDQTNRTNDRYSNAYNALYGNDAYYVKEFNDFDLSATDLLPDDDVPGYSAPNQQNEAYIYDVAVIGGGPAGTAAAIKAARNGAKVILFEKGELGGSCLGDGMPFLTYKKSAEILRQLRASESRGISGAAGVSIDWRRAYEHRKSVAANIVSGIARVMRSYRIHVEMGEAVLKNANEIFCLGRVYTAAKIIICSGTRPGLPAIPGISHSGVLTNTDVLELSEIPSRLLVFGGDKIGCEIATVFSAFGSNVMLVEKKERLLPDLDAQVSESVGTALKAAGVKVYTGISIKEITDRDGYPFVITERGGVLCDKVTVSFGRTPDLGILGSLTNEFERRDGALAVDEYMQTSVGNIFAVGDIAGANTPTNAVYQMAEIAADNALGKRRAYAYNISAAPIAVYTIPEAASVGLTEAEARDLRGEDLLVGISSLTANARAILSGETEGFVKVLARKPYGEILGVHIVGTGASELIAEPAALMRMEVTIHEVVSDIIKIHPTFGEAFADAAADALGKGITSRKR